MFLLQKGIYYENKCFKKNMEIMSQPLEKHKIEVSDELEKPVESSMLEYNPSRL